MTSIEKPDLLPSPDAEEAHKEGHRIPIDTMEKNANWRIRLTQDNEKKESVERAQILREISLQIDAVSPTALEPIGNAQEQIVVIGGSVLQQLVKAGIADRLVGIMRTTFNNPNIQLNNCAFSATSTMVDGNSHRAIVVQVNGSDTRLSFGFDRQGSRSELGQIQLNEAETKLVQSLFR